MRENYYKTALLYGFRYVKVINMRHNDNVNANLGCHLNLCQQFINHYLIPFGCILCFYLNFSACKTSITELSECCEKAINNLQSRFGIPSAQPSANKTVQVSSLYLASFIIGVYQSCSTVIQELRPFINSFPCRFCLKKYELQ